MKKMSRQTPPSDFTRKSLPKYAPSACEWWQIVTRNFTGTLGAPEGYILSTSGPAAKWHTTRGILLNVGVGVAGCGFSPARPHVWPVLEYENKENGIQLKLRITSYTFLQYLTILNSALAN